MREHRPESEQLLPGHVQTLRRVILPEVPAVCALHHPDDGVTAWVFALPCGGAIIAPLGDDGETEGTGLILTTLELAATRWAALDDADLVLVAA